MKLSIKPQYGPFVSGSFILGKGKPIPVYNPATGELLSTVTSPSAEEVRGAIHRSQTAFQSGVWSRTSTHHRSMILSKLARSLESKITEFAQIESQQTGRTIREMRAQLGRLPEWLDYYAALLRTHTGFVAPTQGKLLNYVTRVPLGVVAQITPFNHPLLIALKKMAPALAAGNSVVVKPSELAPVSVLEFAQLAHKAGIPPDVLNVLPGAGPEMGKEIVTHPAIRKVDVTAGTNTGRAIGSLAGSNVASYIAELGGKAPVVVFDDADIPSAVNGVAFAAYIASGQTCVSGTRLILDESIYDEFMASFIDKVKAIKAGIGDPSNPKSTMGAVISHASLQRLEAVVSRTRGKVLIGGKRMAGISALDGFDLSAGSFYAPTVIEDIDVEDELWKEEVFGPILVVTKFQNEEQAISLANHCKYGLGAGLWTRDISRAHRLAALIESGLVWVNTHHRNDPSSPWGGMKESGIGRENGIEAFEAYSQTKSVIVNISSTEETRQMDDWFSTTDSKRYG